jgi:hypothetical protein
MQRPFRLHKAYGATSRLGVAMLIQPFAPLPDLYQVKFVGGCDREEVISPH